MDQIGNSSKSDVVSDVYVMQQCPGCLGVIRDPRARLPRAEYVKVAKDPFPFVCDECGIIGVACYSLEWHIRHILRKAHVGTDLDVGRLVIPR